MRVQTDIDVVRMDDSACSEVAHFEEKKCCLQAELV